jgi:hypothetical protein
MTANTTSRTRRNSSPRSRKEDVVEQAAAPQVEATEVPQAEAPEAPQADVETPAEAPQVEEPEAPTEGPAEAPAEEDTETPKFEAVDFTDVNMKNPSAGEAYRLFPHLYRPEDEVQPDDDSVLKIRDAILRRERQGRGDSPESMKYRNARRIAIAKATAILTARGTEFTPSEYDTTQLDVSKFTGQPTYTAPKAAAPTSTPTVVVPEAPAPEATTETATETTEAPAEVTAAA